MHSLMLCPTCSSTIKTSYNVCNRLSFSFDIHQLCFPLALIVIIIIIIIIDSSTFPLCPKRVLPLI